MKGKMREKWGKLTDDDWDTVAGKKDQLLGKLQERYGYSREQAETRSLRLGKSQRPPVQSRVTLHRRGRAMSAPANEPALTASFLPFSVRMPSCL